MVCCFVKFGRSTHDGHGVIPAVRVATRIVVYVATARLVNSIHIAPKMHTHHSETRHLRPPVLQWGDTADTPERAGKVRGAFESQPLSDVDDRALGLFEHFGGDREPCGVEHR